jgi:hypothetical protein
MDMTPTVSKDLIWFEQTSDEIYDRHMYKLVYTNKKSIIVDSWEQLRVEWFNAPSKFRSHVDVIDCKSKNNQGFK